MFVLASKLQLNVDRQAQERGGGDSKGSDSTAFDALVIRGLQSMEVVQARNKLNCL